MQAIYEYLLSKSNKKAAFDLDLPDDMDAESVDFLNNVANNDARYYNIIKECKFWETGESKKTYELHIAYYGGCRYEKYELKGIQFIVSHFKKSFKIMGADTKIQGIPFFRDGVLGKSNPHHNIGDFIAELNKVEII